MSKAILVMDMPENCKDCIMSIQSKEKHTGQFCWRCINAPTIMIDKSGDKPDFCPLRPVPEKVTEPIDEEDIGKDYSEGTMDGWNACIDAIGGGDIA